MKATFNVTVKIDGRNVESSLSMREGAENVEGKVVELIMLAADLLHEKIRRGLAPSDKILTFKGPFAS